LHNNPPKVTKERGIPWGRNCYCCYDISMDLSWLPRQHLLRRKQKKKVLSPLKNTT